MLQLSLLANNSGGQRRLGQGSSKGQPPAGGRQGTWWHGGSRTLQLVCGGGVRLLACPGAACWWRRRRATDALVTGRRSARASASGRMHRPRSMRAKCTAPRSRLFPRAYPQPRLQTLWTTFSCQGAGGCLRQLRAARADQTQQHCRAHAATGCVRSTGYLGGSVGNGLIVRALLHAPPVCVCAVRQKENLNEFTLRAMLLSAFIAAGNAPPPAGAPACAGLHRRLAGRRLSPFPRDERRPYPARYTRPG